MWKAPSDFIGFDRQRGGEKRRGNRKEPGNNGESAIYERTDMHG